MAAPPRDVALAEETLEGAAAVVAVAVVEVVVSLFIYSSFLHYTDKVSEGKSHLLLLSFAKNN